MLLIIVRQQLRPDGAGINVLKAQHQEPLVDQIDVIEVLKLAIQRRIGHGNVVFILLELIKAVGFHGIGVMGANADTAPAVNTPLIENDCLTAHHPDRLCGADLDAGGTPGAFVEIQLNRMAHFPSPPM